MTNISILYQNRRHNDGRIYLMHNIKFRERYTISNFSLANISLSTCSTIQRSMRWIKHHALRCTSVVHYNDVAWCRTAEQFHDAAPRRVFETASDDNNALHMWYIEINDAPDTPRCVRWAENRRPLLALRSYVDMNECTVDTLNNYTMNRSVQSLARSVCSSTVVDRLVPTPHQTSEKRSRNFKIKRPRPDKSN